MKCFLLMDMPVQVCQKCVLCYGTKNDNEYLCCATGKLIPDGEKPNWCPLRELPEKRRTIGGEGENDKLMMNAGFNACLEEIMSSKQEDKC